jgi:ribonuclease HI
MSSSDNKYYVVWIGLNPGIYNSWEECRNQVEGWKGAIYK